MNTLKRSRGAQPGQKHALKPEQQRKTVKLTQLSVTPADAQRAKAVLSPYENMIDLIRDGFLAEVARREDPERSLESFAASLLWEREHPAQSRREASPEEQLERLRIAYHLWSSDKLLQQLRQD